MKLKDIVYILFKKNNKLAEQQEDLIKVIHNVPLSSTGSIPSGATSDMIQTDVSSYIPTGYSLLYATLRGTANFNCYCWYFDWVAAEKRVDCRVTNTASTARTPSLTATLMCIKDGSGVG